jgi:hypothetical protein
MAKEERGKQKEENPEKKQIRNKEKKRETTWRTLRAFSLENKPGIEKLLTEDRDITKLISKGRNRKQ